MVGDRAVTKRGTTLLGACVLAAVLTGVLLQASPVGALSNVREEGAALELQLSVQTPGSVARATFSGVGRERVFVSFSPHSFGSGCLETASVTVFAPDARVVASKRALCAAGDFLDTFALPVSGSYEVVIDPAGERTGSVTATIFSVPPDVELAPYDGLYALGDSFTFTISTPGQNAALYIDLVPGTYVLIRIGKNTISAGCRQAVSARVVDPVGRLSVKKTPLCFPRQEFALRARQDGIYELELDPPAARTGRLAVTLYLDQPDVFPEGPFAEQFFVAGTGSYRLNLTALYRRGIARIWVEKTRTGTTASSSLCRRRCPRVRTLRTSVDTRPLREGLHEYRALAKGPDGRRGDAESLRIYVDRTPPRPPRGFRVRTYDPQTQTAAVVWEEGPDPGGAGAAGYGYRLRVDGGRWSPWRGADVPYVEVAPAPPGTVIDLKVREYDGVRRRSSTVQARVRVTGSEPPPEEDARAANHRVTR